jgi:hypothetical protein
MRTSASHADMIEIPRKLEGCMVRLPLNTRKKSSRSRERRSASLRPIKPGILSEYYNYAPFKFIYNEDVTEKGTTTIKPHHFHFHVGLVESNSNKILVEKEITYRDFGIKTDADVERLTAIMNDMKPSGTMSAWFLPFMKSIMEMYEKNIIGAIIGAIQDNTTPDGEKQMSPSEILSTIKITPTIRRKWKGKLIPIEQSDINSVISHKNPSMDYGIYFTFTMKDGAEPHTTKRILSRFCMKKADGSEETRYIIRLPTGEYVSTQEEGKPRVYNHAEPPFRYVGGRRKTRRRQRQRRNRASK